MTNLADKKPFPDSLWRATANPLSDCPSLEGSEECDVGILGAGFTGLSTAVHLRESGIECVVVDQAQPGWGCSGRNGGQVNPMWKVLPSEIRHRYGDQEFDSMLELVSQTCDLVFELTRRYEIDCDALQPGHVHTAIGSRQLGYLERWIQEWKFQGDDVALIDRAEVARLSGTNAYDGAVLARRGGSVQPLSYARGLAAAALGAGARIFGDSQVTSVSREGDRWVMKTVKGQLRCRNIVLAANGYTDRVWPGLKETIVPVASLITSTAPLPKDVAARITPERHAISESSGVPHYYRIDAHRRMVFGGRGSWLGRIGSADTRWLRTEAVRLYPQLADATWEYDWGGYVAITPDHRPYLLELDKGAYAGLGYNGRGVAMATMMGKQLAEAIATGKQALQTEKPRKIPMHPFYPAGILTRMVYGRVSDMLTRR